MTTPTGLYIHLPWCIKKCPYCDFNSHRLDHPIPEACYLQALLSDLQNDINLYGKRTISSIFFGGGTPSLLSPGFYNQLLDSLSAMIPFAPNIEITLEANPGTLESAPLKGFREAGINRLSLGIQSLSNTHLKTLGRIHCAKTGLDAIDEALNAGFNSINTDLMFGLPHQSTSEALTELESLLKLDIPHLSWYQLTLEPNTVFYKQQPPLPDNDSLADLSEKGQTLLQAYGYEQYEVSAYAKNNLRAQHNLNYWRYGDYFGLGAGAHGKLTLADNTVWRTVRSKMPKQYLASSSVKKRTTLKRVNAEEQVFEFFLNRLRLFDAITLTSIQQRLPFADAILKSPIQESKKNGWLLEQNDHLLLTERGRQVLDSVVSLFLPPTPIEVTPSKA